MDTKTSLRAAWREKNREKIRAYDRARYALRPEKVKARAAAWHRANPDRVRLQKIKWRDKNREKMNAAERVRYAARGGHRWKKLGVDRATFDALHAKQCGACAICATREPGKKGWALDHDHATGRVRGVLCNPCNLALGLMQDDGARIRAAASYVERHAALGEIM